MNEATPWGRLQGWTKPPVPGRRDPALSVSLGSAVRVPGVRAGSALVRCGDRLLVVGDDASAVTWLDPRTGQARQQVLAGDGAPLPKLLKPDFEAAAAGRDGAVWLFGSGSLPNRRHLVRLSPLHEGADVATYDAEPLFEALAAHLPGHPNIEGAVFLDGVLRLFHRAAGPDPDLWLDLTSDRFAEEPRVVGHGGLALGTLHGVPLHLTDAAALPDGRLVFLAAAEDTADAVADGPVAGSVVGVLETDGARWCLLPGIPKAEGLALGPDGGTGHLVTDADDPASTATLVELRLIGPW